MSASCYIVFRVGTHRNKPCRFYWTGRNFGRREDAIYLSIGEAQEVKKVMNYYSETSTFDYERVEGRG